MSHVQYRHGPYLPTPQASGDDTVLDRKASRPAVAKKTAKSWLSTTYVAEPSDELDAVSDRETLQFRNDALIIDATVKHMEHADARLMTTLTNKTKSRSHPCSVDSSSTEDDKLTKSLKMHSCSICPIKTFRTSNDFDRHMKSVHAYYREGDVGWQCKEVGCKVADKIWPRRDNFKHHLLRVHGKSSDADLDLYEVDFRKKALSTSRDSGSAATSTVRKVLPVTAPVQQREADLCSMGDVFQTHNPARTEEQSIDLDNLKAAELESVVHQQSSVHELQPPEYPNREYDIPSRTLSDLVLDDECAVSDDESTETFVELTTAQEQYAVNLAGISMHIFRYGIPSGDPCTFMASRREHDDLGQSLFTSLTQLATSSSSSNKKRLAPASQGTSQKRPRFSVSFPQSGINNGINDDVADNNDDDGNRKEASGATTPNVHPESAKSFACPYRKHDPLKFGHGMYRACRTGHFRDITPLKQHLKRVHEAPEFYCPKCYEKFTQSKDKDVNKTRRDQHVRECEANKSCPWPDTMTLKQAGEIRRKHRRRVNVDAERWSKQLWYEIFKILFPESSTPNSPYSTPEDEVYIRTVYVLFLTLGPEAYWLYQRIYASALGSFPEPVTREIVDRAYELFQSQFQQRQSVNSPGEPAATPSHFFTPSRSVQNYSWTSSEPRDSGIGTEARSPRPQIPRHVQPSASSFDEPSTGSLDLPPSVGQPDLLDTSSTEDLFAHFMQHDQTGLRIEMNTHYAVYAQDSINAPLIDVGSLDLDLPQTTTFAMQQEPLFYHEHILSNDSGLMYATGVSNQFAQVVDPSRLSTSPTQPSDVLRAVRNVNRAFPHERTS